MTDKEFLETIERLIAHARERRQQSLQAANVDEFKQWDACFTSLDLLRLKPLIQGMTDRLTGGKLDDPPSTKG
jgi:hypothetical protein